VHHKFHTKVYYKDVDKMGVVYYSRYFEYFEQGRTELLNSVGLNVSEIEDQGIFLPVVLAHCEYNKSARFEDKIIITSKINELPKSRMKINYLITKYDPSKKIASGWTEHAFMKENGKPTRAPKLFLNSIKQSLKS
jgi:acyl-CoA thioester hydrolase